MTKITEYEYIPSARKGKYNEKKKKLKKYEPKAQKRNLNQTRRHKIINAEIDAFNDNMDMMAVLIDILNTENIVKWNIEYEELYKEYDLAEIKGLKKGYMGIQHKEFEEWVKDCEVY